jgi:hypothetical protein
MQRHSGYCMTLKVSGFDLAVLFRAWHLQYVPADQPTNMLSIFALQYVQPVLWFR